MKKVNNWLFDYPNLKVYQYEEGFKFSLDSIMLAEFAQIKKNDKKIIDLCTGNAVIPILINYKYSKNVDGIEIQKEIYDLAVDSVNENGMGNNVNIVLGNVSEIEKYFPGNIYDVVLSNPPYFKFHSNNYVNNNTVKSIARHEIMINLSQLFHTVHYLLRDKGRFYLVHIPERIEEIVKCANDCHLSLKELQFVSSKKNEKPIIALMCFVKRANIGCKVYPQVAINGLESYQGLFRR